MTGICITCHREMFIKAAGQCRTCRTKHLDNTMQPIGDAKKRVHELVDHYGNIGTAARMVGVSRNTVDRIYIAPIDARITRTAYSTIMAHQKVGEPAPPVIKPADPITWAEVAEYATTPDGLAFIERCKRPAAYRTRKAA